MDGHEHLFLMVEPGWTFTRDGFVPLDGKRLTRLSTRRMSREGNAAVLNDVRFWVDIMSPGERQPIKIWTGASPLELNQVPAFIQLPVGIWGDQNVSDGLSEPPDPASEPEFLGLSEIEEEDDADEGDEDA